jgi:formate hydrogenlyase subunit 3/multisubunit Na+/H+ antiporter MnhD subunit
MWLAGTLPGQHLHVSLLSFIAGIVSLAIFLPSAPFMNWLILFPDEKLVARSFFQRIAIWLVAADGICRFILPQEALSGKDYLLSQGHPTILAILLVSFTLLAQIQGVALAWTEPVLLRRLYDLAFSQSTLLLTAIYLGGKDRTTILILLAVTLIVCSVTIAMPLLHIEQQTRHRTLSSLGGLLINMPRTGILMAMGTIAFAGFPGFAMASAFAFFSFAGWTIAPLLLTLLLVTLAGILLGRTLGSLFLGEDPKASFRPRDLSPWSFTLGIMLLIPLSILAFHPPGSSGGGFQQTELKQIISVKTGPPK